MKVLFIVIGIIILIAAIIALRVFFGLGHPGNAAPMPCAASCPGITAPCGEKPSCVSDPPFPPGSPPAGSPS